MILSILIPTLPERRAVFTELYNEIQKQINPDHIQSVEILFDPSPRGSVSTGMKRDYLLMRARGKYVWFVDDDDSIMEGAISNIIEGSKHNPDSFAINGIMTTDGGNTKKWYIAIDNPYCADWSTGEEVYLRYPNHITPMKRELVNQFRFKDMSNFEDKDWADQIKAAGVLKTEYKIDIPVYHYRYSTQNKAY